MPQRLGPACTWVLKEAQRRWDKGLEEYGKPLGFTSMLRAPDPKEVSGATVALTDVHSLRRRGYLVLVKGVYFITEKGTAKLKEMGAL